MCPACHPSCSDCLATAGVCDSCKAGADAASSANGAACRCIDGKGTNSANAASYHGECVNCAESCATCYSDQITKCYTCKVSRAIVSAASKEYGSCGCGKGFIPFPNPTTEEQCIRCLPSGCPFCTGAFESQCYPSEIGYNVVAMGGSFGVPTTTATHICYNQPIMFPAACERNILEDIMGPLTVDGNGVYTPTHDQCNRLLRSIWPTAEFWFPKVFPTLDPPTTMLQKSFFQAFLMIVLLQFSPAALLHDSDWTDIVTAFNAPATAWENYMFWGGASIGYTIDGGATALEFPPNLKAWLQPKCPSENCMLFMLLNMGNTVCSNPSCVLSVQCTALAGPGSACAS